jgi:DNA-directed RNA polymerase subunit N (RpoN/RPB10)
MHTPPGCFSCGCSVGHLSEIYRFVREIRVSKKLAELGTAPENAATDIRLKMDMSDLLDKLGIRADCCRVALTTTMQWKEMY